MLAHVPPSRKRTRDADDHGSEHDEQSEKKARPTIEAFGDSDSWARDSVLNTPTTAFHARLQPKYDSDNDLSSVVSEPGSPQDMDMDMDMDDEDDHEDEDDVAGAFHRSPNGSDASTRLIHGNGASTAQHNRSARIPTPTVSSRLTLRPQQHYRDSIKQHVRQRHPQENLSSDHLGPPSPIDEDEVPTPPSAAEAAGSRLSLLSMNDVDMDAVVADHHDHHHHLPTIAVHPTQAFPDDNNDHHHPDSAISDFQSDLDIDQPMDHGSASITATSDTLHVRKQRQRSGALSSSQSPVRAASSGPSQVGGKRGFSIGYRADCDKCQMRVPGHMNHFIA